MIGLLGLVYWQAAHGLTARIDTTLDLEVASLLPSTPDALPIRIRARLAANVSRNTHIALFSAAGALVAGDISRPLAGVKADGRPVEWDDGPGQRAPMRVIAEPTPWGETLVVGRDMAPVLEVRAVILHALVLSGLLIATVGLTLATALSISPLRRLRTLQAASRSIAAGRLDVRMPMAGRHDELDLFAGTVNVMVGEIERLMEEVKSVTDAVAHDLRTPLTRVRASLYRVAHQADTPAAAGQVVERALDDLDLVLERFAALMRISELETRHREAGFADVDLGAMVLQAVELYDPLAEERGVGLRAEVERASLVRADPRLLFEALSNLVDNAIKFTSPDGHVLVAVRGGREGPELSVTDDGPGIPIGERTRARQRFYRGANAAATQGSGLGLSLVAAIMRLHRFELRLEGASPGLRAVLACSPHIPDGAAPTPE